MKLDYSEFRKVRIDSLLVFVSIVVTFFIFFMQQANEVTHKIESVKSANQFNCNVAKSLTDSIPSELKSNHPTSRGGNRYFTEVYKNNLYYLKKGLSSEAINTSTIAIIVGMDQSNRLLDMTLEAGQESMKEFIVLNGDQKMQSAQSFGQLMLQYDQRVLEIASSTIIPGVCD